MKDEWNRGLAVSFRGKRVLVLGDVMLDEYIWGEARRISQEAPVPVVEVLRRSHVPGGASNTAANLAALGGEPHLLGIVGKDHPAQMLRDALDRSGVRQLALVVDDSRATTIKTRVVAFNQQIVRVDSEDRTPLQAHLEDQLLQEAEARLPQVDACIISDYNKGVVSERVSQQFIQLARRANKPVVVDPKGTNFAKYCGATVIKPNLNETELVAKQPIASQSDLEEVGARLLGILGGSALLVTRGASGMSLFRMQAPPVHIATLARRVFDVTGAGDTVASVLALGLAARGSLEDSIQLANRAASLVVAKVGTATVTVEELLEDLQDG